MNEDNKSSQDVQNTQDTRDTATYQAVKRLAIPESLMPVKDIPELLVENRRICMELAKQLMQPMAALSQFFGIPLMEVIFDSVPEEAEQENLEADGIREAAAAKTYWDLKGAVSLTDICKSMHASKVPALKLASAEMQERHSIQKMCGVPPAAEAEREDDAQPISPEGAHDAQEDVTDSSQGKEDMS